VLRVLGAWGDGRVLVTDGDELAERVRMLRDNGRISHNAHRDYSYDSRLDTIQVMVLRAKLERYEMIQLDMHYLQGWSFASELRILARTLPAMLRGGGM
jgi:dTDP-4-amino-4,6-dideoxygalactose transaminase